MENFDNFFDGDDKEQPRMTPVYHTPGGSNPRGERNGKRNTAAIVLIVVSAFLCLMMIVNVVVLASLKDEIAEKYAASIDKEISDAYNSAIQEALNKTDIVEDIKNSAESSVLDKINLSVSELAADEGGALYSTAAITAYYNNSTSRGVAAGFLITDGANRYVVTNAHVVLGEYVKSTGIGPWGQATYEFRIYDKIYATFFNDATAYELEVVACGAYKSEHVSDTTYRTLPDLALLRFKNAQPDAETNPSLKIASSKPEIGSEIALIGNPAGYGLTITSGCISNPDPDYDFATNWGYGDYLMTDAAINGGNSGGPIVNRAGVVVGIVESKIASTEIENIGFAVAATTLIEFLEWAESAQNNLLGADIVINYTAVAVG